MWDKLKGALDKLKNIFNVRLVKTFTTKKRK